jgi:hypothetical protein
VVRPVPASFIMSLKRVLKTILPENVYGALSVLKNGVPDNPFPSMIVAAEAEFFRKCAREIAPQGGAIVDLGCWMGATAVALAQGLRERPGFANADDAKVIAYDQFIWLNYMDGLPTYGIYAHGDCFLPEARRLALSHGGGLVELNQADLGTFEWDARPIALLLVDAMKDPRLARQIARTFYPHLIPHAVLIHQDFKHYHTSWIHLLQYRLRKHFRFIHSVQGGGTVAFEVVAPPTEDDVSRVLDFEAAADDEVEEAFRHSIRLLEGGEISNVAAAHVMHSIHQGRYQRASETLARYRAQGVTDQGDMSRVVGLLAERTQPCGG